MSRKVRIFRFSAGLLCALLVASILLAAAPVKADQQPTAPNFVGQGIGPSATVTARISTVWAGPGRGFWSVGVLHRGNFVPMIGISADGMWIQVTTDFGTGWVWANEVTTSGSVPVVNPGPIGRIISGEASIRSNPGIDAAAISVIGRNREVFILGSNANGTWLKIRFRFGKGWVRANLISTSVAVTATISGPVAIVNAGALNVRTGPSLLFRSLGSLPGGTKLPIIGRSRDGVWLQVQSSLGVGWVNSIHVITLDYFGGAPITAP